MFSQGSALYGLVTDFNAGNDPALGRRIEALIGGLDRRDQHEADYLWFPEVATSIAPCAHMAAYQVLHLFA
jgi:glycerol uptake facilitator-like aquaporin